MHADVRIDSLAAGGDGVARHDGLAVFVPRSAVGDVVRVALTPRGRYARGRLEVLHTASPDRVTPPCVHYERDGCGGCQWQHLTLEAQRAAKARVVADAFARLAGQPIATPEVRGDAHAYGYRRTASFTVRGQGAARRGGFHAVDDPDTIVPIARCLLLHDDLQAAWAALQPLLSRLPDTRGAARNTAVRSAAGSARARTRVVTTPSLRVTLRRLDDGSVALAVEGGARWRADDIAAVARALPRGRGVWWTPDGAASRLVWDRDATPPDAPTLDAADALSVAASFVQVNATLADALHAHVLELVRAAAPRRVCDAYAGSGRLSVALDADGVEVTAIERDARACRYAAARLSARARVLTGAVEDRLAEALPADVVVLNPPRAGCAPDVCAVLSAAVRGEVSAPPPRRVVYVSCDPATLARDVRRLAGWRVAAVTCFDLFPQTAHVETVCLLLPEAA